jgi:hypothetical protein
VSKTNPYKTDVKNSKGHILGYITDGDTFPEGSVQDCLNMDFYKGQDERRPPYVVDIASTDIPLPTGYSIQNRIRKEFTDSTGASKFVHIIVATKQGDSPARTRIYMKGYFCPSAECENSYKASPDGFNDDWVEITEWWVDGQGVSFTYDTNKMITTNTELFHPAWYFKNFFVINNVGEIIGLVTNSYNTDVGGTITTTLEVDLDEGAELVTGCGVCRFPVNQFNVENWINITDVKLNGELSNIVKLYCGDDSRTLQLNFIKKRTYFGDSYIGVKPDNAAEDYIEQNYYIYQIENFGGNIKIYYNIDGLELNQTGFDNPQYVTFKNVLSPYSDLDGQFLQVITSGKIIIGDPTDKRYWVEVHATQHGSITYTQNISLIMLSSDTAYPKHVDYIDSISGLYNGDKTANYYIRCAKDNPPLTSTVSFYWKRDDITAWTPLGTYTYPEIVAGQVVELELGLKATIKTVTPATPVDFNSYQDIARIRIIQNPLTIVREGFEFDFEAPDILNRKEYSLINANVSAGYIDVTKNDIGSELGISYRATGTLGVLTPTPDSSKHVTNYDRAYSLAIELDGYQVIFVRQILANDWRLLTIKGTLQKYFNRRITACLLFFDEWSYSVNPETIPDGIVPLTSLCDKTIPGYLPIARFNASLDTGINAYIFDIVTNVNFTSDGAITPTYTPDIKYKATGLSLNAYLNQEYWKSILCYAKKCIKVNKSLIAFKLSQANVDEDVEKSQNVIPKVGKNSICVGEYQQAFLDANSIMSSERQYEATLEEILNGCATEPGQFLLFTSQKCYWYELTDVLNVSTGIKHIGTFLNKGLVSEKGMVAAIFTDKAARGTADEKYSAQQFSGVFWAGFDSIYAFFNNEPVDLLIEKWKEEYQLIPIEVKETVQTGYNPVTKDIWFHFVFSTGAVQYVFNLENKHWKKYNIQEEINNLEFNEEGLITWHDDTDLFKLLSRWDVSGVFMDTNDTGIEMLIKEINNHGTKLVTKIPDMFYMTYECENTENNGDAVVTLNDAKFNLKVSSDDNSNDIYSKDFSNLVTKNSSTKQDFKKEILFRLRQRCNYYTVELSMSESEAENVKKLKIFDFSSQAKLTGHQLTRV